jgi:hypothetical protein
MGNDRMVLMKVMRVVDGVIGDGGGFEATCILRGRVMKLWAMKVKVMRVVLAMKSDGR